MILRPKILTFHTRGLPPNRQQFLFLLTSMVYAHRTLTPNSLTSAKLWDLCSILEPCKRHLPLFFCYRKFLQGYRTREDWVRSFPVEPGDDGLLVRGQGKIRTCSPCFGGCFVPK